jgi:hypothetical protein
VAEGLYHHARRDALSEKERGAGVAEIVEPLGRQTGLPKDGLEPAGDRAADWRRPLRRGRMVGSLG